MAFIVEHVDDPVCPGGVFVWFKILIVLIGVANARCI